MDAMTANPTKKRKLVLTTTLAILIPALFFLFLGCMKTPSKDVDYGDEASLEDIGEILKEGVANFDVSNVQVGQFVYFDKTQAIRGTSTIIVLQEDALKIVSKVDGPNAMTFEYEGFIREYQPNGTYLEYPVGDFASFQKGIVTASVNSTNLGGLSLAAASTENLDAYLRMQYLKASETVKPNTSKITKITYHNVVTTRSIEEAPPLIKKTSDCQGLPECKIRVTTLSFDQVVWRDEVADKVAVKISYSPDLYYIRFSDRVVDNKTGETARVPFKDNLVQECWQQSVPVEDQKVLLSVCNTLQDFRFYE